MSYPFIELRALQVGERFEVIGLEHLFRNLIILNITDSCVSVKGETCEGESEERPVWRSLINHTMSGRTEVRRA